MTTGIHWGIIVMTTLALTMALIVIKLYPDTSTTLNRFMKQLEYYKKRWSINRTFKRWENDVLYSTFLKSWVDLGGALNEAGERYHLIVRIRYNVLMDLIQEYQPYFRKELQYHPPK